MDQTSKRPGFKHSFNPYIWWVVVGVTVVLCFGSVGYSAAEPSPRLSLPSSRINDPFDAPIYLTGHLSAVASVRYDPLQWGAGGTILFRPGVAGQFLRFLYDWNLSLILQADYQKLATDRRSLSGDFIVRHYFVDMVDKEILAGAFVGAGIGASEIQIHTNEGDGMPTYWSWTIEAGHEWKFHEKYLIQTKLQYRNFVHAGFNYSSWSLQAGLGLPIR